MNVTNDMIARDVMGWTESSVGGFSAWKYNDRSVGLSCYDGIGLAYFNPLADYNHCRLVEERMKKLGLLDQYIEWLFFVCRKDDQSWWQVQATAAQRCEAAYRAWKEWSDDR